MEEFFQYVGRASAPFASNALLTKEKLFLYASPRENPIDRCVLYPCKRPAVSKKCI